MNVIILAEDDKGNTFPKTIKLLNSADQGPVVSLGFPCQWYLADIQKPPIDGSDKIYIDAIGRNHKGSPVWVSHEKLLNIVNVMEEENMQALKG